MYLSKSYLKGDLFLDNFSVHLTKLKFSHIRIEFYPPNCTSLLQHLDQGIIPSFLARAKPKYLKQVTYLKKVK